MIYQNYYRYVFARAKVQLQSGQWVFVNDTNEAYYGIVSVTFSGLRDAEYITSTHRVDQGSAVTFTIRK